jgi:uncharacterized membrane protein YciS (DUF1049 family)
MTEQNFANHAKVVPPFHYFVVPVLILNFVWSIYRLVHTWFTLDALVGLLTAAALVMLMFLARLFALRVQDRVIRLEERLRLNRLLPEALKPRIEEFTPGQLIALRFASDTELPALANKVLNENLTDVKAVKRLVQRWRPDHLRA